MLKLAIVLLKEIEFKILVNVVNVAVSGTANSVHYENLFSLQLFPLLACFL